MIGCNMLGMWWNARQGDVPDRDRIAMHWGWSDPSLNVRWDELGGRIIRPWKWHKVWHSFKHLCVEWTRLDANRGAKLWMDWVAWPWLILLGLLIRWLLF
jgi:hypothetical protein